MRVRKGSGMWKWVSLAVLGVILWVGYLFMKGDAMNKQFEACLQGAYSIADITTRNADDRSSRYEVEALKCARQIEHDWQKCWPIGGQYAGDPKLCRG